MTMQYELYKIMKYQTKLKKSTQKSKNLIYKSKLKYHLYNINQYGGIFYNFNLTKEELNDHKLLNGLIVHMFSKFTPDQLVKKKDYVGEGVSGVVYAFSKELVIKFIKNVDIFKIEQRNNNLINILSSYNPFFPKYYYMDIIHIPQNEIHIKEQDIGIIITDKLSPIYDFFQETRNGENNKTYKNFKDNFLIENRIAFYKQFYFILYSIYDLYRRNGSILLHNDIKMDNFLIKEIKGDINMDIIMTLHNGTKLNIPYIVYNDKKYILILNDYGNSYTYNSQTLTESFPSNNMNSILKIKFLGYNVSNKLFKEDIKEKINNMDYIDIEITNMLGADDIDKFIYRNGTPYFNLFKNNIRNINLPVDKIIQMT